MSRTSLIIGIGVALLYAGAYFALYQGYLGTLAADQDAAVSLVERGFSAEAVLQMDGPPMPFLLALLRFPIPHLWTLLGGSTWSLIPVLIQALLLGALAAFLIRRRRSSR
ncbi:hypothetical protein OB2597_06710 [Pseudooceanicola batsensis HTCC2597]|uniref:Uncharacterized protein n=1 Tax=Pseudooceanicola batsensis (strain ATCC BAA-863 / DSM 15984 / KCTC 12145 / HTCC2597) TaxID=252305 RepID=A3TTH7_PSEBH|nr:hypothetical protein [Pseudooceanicola batsensis]EAQ04954.1 hypothetical protein OB2597_06710 [Pseudooceanicola batsensis HTCC2597]